MTSINGSTYLNCSNCGTATSAKNVSFAPSQCNCVNAFDAIANRTYLSCVCRNVTQCPDLSSFQAPAPAKVYSAPCQTSYPCSCSATNATNNSSTVACSCANPSTNMSANITLNTSACSSFNIWLNSAGSKWYQNGQCCLNDNFVRANLIPPVTCSDSSMIKEKCQCNNSTVSSNSTVLTCNCSHPTTSVVSSNLSFGNQQCDCPNINLGSKSCACCVSWTTQLQ